MKTNQIILIIIVILLIVFGVYYVGFKNDKTDLEENNNNSTEEISIEREIEGNKEDLVSFSVQPNQEVAGLLNFQGVVRNAYFFEANIGINILDANKKLLKAGNAMATTDWMTSEPVSFEGSIDLTGLPTGPGYIQIANDNASGLPKYDKFIYIPVVIGQ
jgi:hypothetical protein